MLFLQATPRCVQKMTSMMCVQTQFKKPRPNQNEANFRSDLRLRTLFATLGLLFINTFAWAQNPIKQTEVLPAAPPLALPPGARPIVVVTLSKPIYRITANPKNGAPQMPKEVIATAEIQNLPVGFPLPETFTWRVLLDWEFAKYKTSHEIGSRTFEQSSPFKVDLSKQIAGGKLKVYAKAMIGGQEFVGVGIAEVLADNPPRRAMLAAFPPNRFGLIASKIATAESDLRQFTNPKGRDPGGIPYTSKTSDVGMMQLNITSAGLTSPEQVWDWRANLKRGLEMINEKKRVTHLASRSSVDRNSSSAAQIPGFMQLICINSVRIVSGLEPVTLPDVSPLSEMTGSGIQPEDLDPDKVELSQMERDAIRRYNGGREYSYLIIPNIEALDIQFAGWSVDPTRGGIRARSGDPEYVRHVLAARSGFTIPPPPKPKPIGKAHRKRRRHRS